MILAALIGVAAGVASGLLGIGGGILFVPALTILLGLHQVEAEATSLLAIVPVALVGSWRQRAYGNLRAADAARHGRAVDRSACSAASRSRTRYRSGCCGSASRCCCSTWRASSCAGEWPVAGCAWLKFPRGDAD